MTKQHYDPPRLKLRSLAVTALRTVGNAELGEWHEWTGYAYHIRRRLTPEEQLFVGDAADCRGSEEAEKRFEACRLLLPKQAIEIARQEIGPEGVTP